MTIKNFNGLINCIFKNPLEFRKFFILSLLSIVLLYFLTSAETAFLTHCSSVILDNKISISSLSTPVCLNDS